MLKPPGEPNAILDTSVLPKLTGGPGTKRLAGAAGVCEVAPADLKLALHCWSLVTEAPHCSASSPACTACLAAAGVVHEVTLSRVGNLTCPVAGEQGTAAVPPLHDTCSTPCMKRA